MDILMKDTIAAISTPPGEGGIGIVRISGDNALKIARQIFINPKGKPGKIEPRKVCYGSAVNPDTGEVVDQVLLTYMPGPRSYTTQDVIEINCHGGPLVLKSILNLAVSKGARVAGPGEFTQRAFMGGRLDLAQAEAVMDLIRSRTDRARQVAMNQLEGVLSKKVNALREDLIDLLMQLEVRMDFCEDDVPALDPGYKSESISKVITGIETLLEEYETGRILREGVRACIIGPPNVGKSTLLNTLLKQERAIVTEHPGTTRDRIEEVINFQGAPLILIDTAGIRRSDDPVETIGVQMAIDAAKQADVILMILDASSKEIPEIVEIAAGLAPERTLVVMNKIDLGINYPSEIIKGRFSKSRVVEVSLRDSTNLDALDAGIIDLILDKKVGAASDIILTNARHRDALVKTREYLISAQKAVEDGMADDFITIDVNAALSALGEITGKVLHSDIMDRVFSNFCIGK